MLRCLTALSLVCAGAMAHAAPDRGAQVELATYGAVYGLGLGVLTSVEADVNLRPAAWITAATTAGGLFGGLALVDELDMSLSQVRMTGSLAAWSMIDAGLIGLWPDWDDDGLLWVMAGAGALGAGGGVLLSSQGFEPSLGDISMVNSGGLWMVPTGLLLALTFHVGSVDDLPRDVFVLAQAGLATGAFIAARYRPTREQVLTLDLGLFIGASAGSLLGTILLLYTDSTEALTTTVLLGMGLGAWLALDSTGFGGGAQQTRSKAAEQARPFAMSVPIIGGRF